MTKEVSRSAKEKRFLLLKEKALRRKRANFWAYCLHMDNEFFTQREEILKPIAIDMQRLIDPLPGMTEVDIMNVSLPPRTGKSYLCSLFVTWTFGKYPGESIMRNTVTGKLYKKFSGDIKDIISGETHKGKHLEIFPDMVLATTSVEGWKLKSSKQGISYFGAGIEGNIIGLGATKLSILDDSVADEFDALNEYSLDKKWAWYGSASDSREEQGCKRLFIGTRWSKKDIVGRLIDLGFFESDRAINIVVPAFNKDGKSYCEKIHTTEKLLEKKLITSDIIWEAEWMQNPKSSKGLLYPSDTLNWFKMEEIATKKPDGIIAFVDVANRGKDYLAAPIGYLYGQDIYIVDFVYTQDGVELTQPELAQKIIDWNIEITTVESNNEGLSFAKKIEDLVEGESQCTVEEKWNSKNKETRIIMKSGFIKTHFYFRDDMPTGSQYNEAMKEVMSYSKAGKNRFDDATDSLAGLADAMDYDPDRFAI